MTELKAKTVDLELSNRVLTVAIVALKAELQDTQLRMKRVSGDCVNEGKECKVTVLASKPRIGAEERADKARVKAEVGAATTAKDR